jgi:HSP20 family protein
MNLIRRSNSPLSTMRGGAVEEQFGHMVEIDGQRVTIDGECQQANEQRQGEQVVYSERSTRRYQRSFTLPSEVDDTGAEARLENGILMLTLPKKQGTAARRLTIQ